MDPRWLAVFLLLPIGLCVLPACDDDAHTDAGARLEDAGAERTDADAERTDADVDADEDDELGPRPVPDAGEGGLPDADFDDAGSPPPCERHADCDDGLVCNGRERCEAGTCVPGTPMECTREHPCREETRGCDCRNPNVDGDGYDAKICGGDDCDDGNPHVHPGAVEVCDPLGVDEDCDPATFHERRDGVSLDGDADGDGHISDQCFNLDEDGTRYGGEDCDDHQRTVHPEAPETCDYRDNDCDGYVDELPDTGQDHTLWVTFYEDADGDGFGNEDVTFEGCAEGKPPGYVSDHGDCNDDPAMDGAKQNPVRTELCDGIDNDCNGLVDADDPDLLITQDFEDTEVACTEGALEIVACPNDRMWCDMSTVSQGCETHDTRLSSCRECETDCGFACGEDGCDEIEQLTAGVHHSCAVTTEGRSSCWGRGAEGRLGNDGTSASVVPVEVAIIEAVSKIAAGDDFTCAIATSADTVYCWGHNQSGQLGNPDGGDYSPVPLDTYGVFTLELSEAVDVAAGAEHACAVLLDGSVVCWGQTEHGRLGDDFTDPTPGGSVPVYAQRQILLPGDILVAEDIWDATAVSAGERHTCMINLDQGVECWGANDLGQLGVDDALSESGTALAVELPGPVTQIAAGVNYTCALSMGAVYCWGGASNGQLGRPSSSDNHVPTAVAGLSDVADISAGGATTCAVTSDGALYCWGSNATGQLGMAGQGWSDSPIEVSVGAHIVEVAVAGHVCVRADDGRAQCWGNNNFGQMGSGERSVSEVITPVPIRPLLGSVP